MKTTSIIGAGPAANHLAYHLAKKKWPVHVYEEHKIIGNPIQCTGIMTHAIKEMIPLKAPVLVNECQTVRVFAPNKKFLDFKLKKKDVIVHRAKFDQYLAKRAQKESAKYHLDHRYTKNEEKKLYFTHNKKEVTTTTDILVGADGPNSQVAKNNDLFNNRQFAIGHQVTAKIEMDPSIYEVWLGYGAFAWVVPECDKTARIGLVATHKTKEIFDQFFNMRAKDAKIISHEPGPIPIYDPKIKTQKDFVYLLGDAATMVKATSYGGIIQGMLAAEELAKAITENKSYEKLWRKKIHKDLYMHLKLRHVLDKFSPEEYNELLNLLTKPKTREVIETNERDFLSKFAIKIALSQPRLLKYITKLF